MKRSSLCCFAVATVLFCAGCSNRLSTNDSRQASVSGQSPSTPAKDTASESKSAAALVQAQNQQVSVFNAEVETAVANESLIAWRKATAGDEKGALAMFDDLDRRYPDILTLKFMRAQVYEHFGQKKEALKYYTMASTGNEFSSLRLFKVAEMKRTTGDAKGAMEDYRTLIARAPDFVPAKIGLAECLNSLDSNSEEAKKLVDDVLAVEPKNKEAIALQLKFKNK